MIQWVPRRIRVRYADLPERTERRVVTALYYPRHHVTASTKVPPRWLDSRGLDSKEQSQ